MRRSNLNLFSCAVLSLGALGLAGHTYAASVGSGGYSNDFATQPLAVDWSTFSIGGVTTDISGVGGMDSAVQGISASAVASQVAADQANPPPILTTATWSATGFYLQTRPTGNAATLLMCTLSNALGGNAASVSISYDSVKMAQAVEEIPGQLAYYSLSGLPGSWAPIPEFSSANPGRLSVTLNVNWPNGGNLYLLWADDNDSPSPDTAVQIDNFTVTATPAAQTPAIITASPQSQAVDELQPAGFAVSVSGNPPPSIQWYTNNVLVAGASTTTFALESAPLGFNGLQVRAVAQNVASNVTYSATSSVATLTVSADTIRPVLLSAVASGPIQVVASFSERLRPASATSVGNYALSGPEGSLNVSSAFLDATQTNVVLTVTTMTSGNVYTLTVNGVTDQSVAGNAVLPNSQFQFTAASYSASDIGGPAGAGSSVAVGNGFAVTGGGTNILGTGDQFAYNARQISGDFDMEIRLDGFTGSDPWAKAGLMARESLTAGSKHASVFATPHVSGTFFSFRPNNGTNTVNVGSFPVAYPSTWLRLKRAGAAFTGYAGVDGQNWVQLGTATLTNPAPLFYIGMAVTSVAPSNAPTVTATAQFRDLGDASSGTVGIVSVPFEPLGPSSRNTGLIISEIMYHPKWSNDLEFVEIFNAGLIGENISGYRIAGSVDYMFPANTFLPAGAFLVVARNPTLLQNAAGISGVLGPWAGASTNALPDDAGTVRVRNRTGAVVLEANYETQLPWPLPADGTGHSLVLARPSYGQGIPQAWSASDRIGGSPGTSDPFGSDPLRNVVINEFLAHTDPPLDDYIELYNHSNVPVDISGAYLSDDRDTNKFRIPNGTTIPARGFVSFITNPQTTGFSLSSAGERIYFVNSSQTRVIDMVIFEPQANGVASGRYPDGSPGIRELSSRTAGTANTPILIRDVVINEIMYNPISESDNDEYVELYNRSAAPVDVSDWRFTAGISYRFAANTVIPPNGYLVVAQDKANLLTKYSQLNTANTVGDYNGSLANSGERVALSRPDYFTVTNNNIVTTQANFVVVDEVTYDDGGRWGRWADGGGSSLELIDPNTDHRYSANWADSDETAKGGWTNIFVTATADNVYPVGGGGEVMNEVQVMLLGAGEALMDDVDVHAGVSGPSIVLNPGFNSGLTSWVIQGNHVRSVLEPAGPNNPSQCLRIVATAGGDNGANRVECDMSGALTANAVATIGGRFRWLRGFPIVLMRVHGGGLEAVATLPVPPNLGTPGLVNSRRVNNAGPAISDVSHAPVLPQANQNVLITARVSDPNGIATVQVRYRLDPSATINNLNMRDDGTGGDAVAGDGLYSATLLGQAANATAAFRIAATDALAVAPGAASSVFPDAASGEALIRFADPAIFGNLGVYRIWMTTSNINLWTTRERLSNQAIDGTFVYGNVRVIYNASARYRGSPFTRNPSSPAGVGVPANYVWTLPDDDLLLGSDELNLDCLEPGGSTNVRDVTGLREVTSFEILSQLNIPFSFQRYVHVVINGITSASRNIPVYTDSQQPNGEYVAMWFPNDDDGDLYKIDDWFEFDDTPARTGNKSASLDNFITTGGAKKQARYRWMWEKKFNRGLDDDYTSLFQAVDALAAPDARYVQQVEGNFDIREWLTALAFRHVVGDWDGYGYRRGKNQFCYCPRGGKFLMLMWDLDFSLGCNSGDPPTQDLFNVSLGGLNGSDHMPEVNRLYTHPHFRRMYLQALHQMATGPMQDANFMPQLDARYRALLANGVTAVTSPFIGSGQQGISIPAWIQQRRSHILNSANGIQPYTNAVLRLTTPTNLTTNNNVALITGNAPLGVKDILINGATWPVTWTGVTSFTARVVLNAGANTIIVSARDFSGSVVTVGQPINATYTGSTPPSPVGQIIFSEIMPYPSVPEAEFVEIVNTSAFSYDVGAWRVNGLDYTFPTGTILSNGQYVVLAKNIGAVTLASGTNTPNIFAEYSGNLDRDGETLTLLQPGTTGAPDVVIDKVRFEARLPWAPTVIGTSLQLADTAEDNSRSSAWSAQPGGGPQQPPSPWFQISRTGNLVNGTNLFFWLTTAGAAYIDDISLIQTNEGSPNIVLNGDFENGSTEPWILGTNYANSIVVSGVSHSGNRSLLVRGGGTTGSILPASVQQWIALNPNYFPNTNYTLTYWLAVATNPVTVGIRTLPGAQFGTNGSTFIPAAPPTPVLATPGAPNTPVTTNLPPFDPIWLNELQAQNVSGPLDNAGERDPWIELYNGGATPVSLNGYYLANNYDTNLTQWPFPAGVTINPKSFLLVWADGQPGQTAGNNLHTSFRLNISTGSVALVRIANTQPQITDYLTYSDVGSGLSYGDFPDGQPFTRTIMQATTAGGTNITRAVNLFVNEWMASNTNFVYDPADGTYSDWFEIYNAGDTAVDLSGYHLTDDFGNPTQFRVPANGQYVIPSHGFLIVWADEDSGSQNIPENADLHVNFRLGGTGDTIGLYGPDGTTIIDQVAFGRQTNDVSQGRFADGSANIIYMTAPTPGGPNRDGGTGNPNVAPQLAPISDRLIRLGQTVSFGAIATDADIPPQTLTYSLVGGGPSGATIGSSSGLFSWTPTPLQAPGTYPITVRVTDNGGPPALSDLESFTVTVQLPPTGTITRNGGQVVVTFDSTPGRTYRVQYADSLALPTPNWQRFGTSDIVATGSSIVINDNLGPGAQRFYQLIQLD